MLMHEYEHENAGTAVPPREQGHVGELAFFEDLLSPERQRHTNGGGFCSPSPPSLDTVLGSPPAPPVSTHRKVLLAL